jgi:hypothetical protein
VGHGERDAIVCQLQLILSRIEQQDPIVQRRRFSVERNIKKGAAQLDLPDPA